MGQFYRSEGVVGESDTEAASYCGELVTFGNNFNAQVQQGLNFMRFANRQYNMQILPLSEELQCHNPRALPGTNTPPLGQVEAASRAPNPINLGGFCWGEDCPEGTFGGINTGGANNNLFELLEVKNRKHELFKNSTGIPWWPGDRFNAIQVYRVDYDETEKWAEPLTIRKNELYRENGRGNGNGKSPKKFEIDFDKGLYTVVLLDNSGVSIPFVAELEGKSISFSNLEDYLGVEIFPSPLTSPRVTTRLKSERNLSFDYIIQGNNGRIYYNRKINMEENEERDLEINTHSMGKNEIIIHKFVFSDGSSKSYTTIKE